MSNESSEQQLKVLERSKDDPNDLLDHAISIVGNDYTEHKKSAHEARYTTHGAFREQWLLRWLLKRLTELSKDDDSSPAFVVNHKTWSFLSYLLGTIPRHRSVEILLERNFTKLLIQASSVVINHHQSISPPQSIEVVSGTDHEGSRKRRRLSPIDAQTSSSSTDQASSTLSQFVQVAAAWGLILQPTQSESQVIARQVIPAWSEPSDAAAFVGCVLRCTSILSTVSTLKEPETSVLSIATQWLRLWHTLSTSTNIVDKATSSKTFNASCLRNCLELHVLLSNFGKSSELVEVRKELEKQIALYTILPIRSEFNTKFAAVWKSDKTTLAWQDIEPTYNMFQEHLSTILDAEIIVKHQVMSLPDPRWASCLLSISSRLIPKDDVRRKQKETPWSQALTVCLAHLAFTREMPKLLRDPDGYLQPENNEMPPSANKEAIWPEGLLAEIATQELTFSAHVREYLACSILYWRNRPLPVKLLCSLVQLEPTTFVPTVGDSNSALRLQQLLVAVEERRLLDSLEHKQVIVSIIFPIMRDFVKARDLKGLLGMWLPNLEEAFRVRLTAFFSTNRIPATLIWDDEDLFSHFRTLCQTNQQTSFDRDLLEELLVEMRTMSDRIGPVTDIFARLAILDGVLKARGQNILQSDQVRHQLGELTDLLAVIAQEQNDYQGQKWRIWSIMLTMLKIDDQFDRFILLEASMKATCERFDLSRNVAFTKLQQNQRAAMLMEQLAIFALLTEHRARHGFSEDVASTSEHRLFDEQILALAKAIDEAQGPYQQSVDSANKKEDYTRWNGKINSLEGVHPLIEGQLACLIQYSGSSSRHRTNMLETLTPIKTALSKSLSNQPNTISKSTPELIMLYLASMPSQEDDEASHDNMDNHLEADKTSVKFQSLGALYYNQQQADITSVDIMSTAKASASSQNQALEVLKQVQQEPVRLTTLLTSGAYILNTNNAELKTNASLAKAIAVSAQLNSNLPRSSSSGLLLRLEHCMLVLKLQPVVVNQAMIDTILERLAIITSAAFQLEESNSEIKSRSQHLGVAIFDRLVGVVGLLLARYRRRLSGRTHLLLCVLQNLLKCFFYTPSKTYLYQNAGASKQKQNFRMSLPRWLDEEALPTISAVRFTKILSSICNPTTASARSAHHSRRKNKTASLELNDETRKAKRIAAQYMQYMIMEYARCTLDGVIRPEVRESLLPGLFSILDAMDKDLMNAMNAAMDPSSRAIFKSLYDDWMKHWRWNQS